MHLEVRKFPDVLRWSCLGIKDYASLFREYPDLEVDQPLCTGVDLFEASNSRDRYLKFELYHKDEVV